MIMMTALTHHHRGSSRELLTALHLLHVSAMNSTTIPVLVCEHLYYSWIL